MNNNNNNNNAPKKSNATALKYVESFLPVVALGMNGVQDRRPLEIYIHCFDQENPLFGSWIAITKAPRSSAPGKFVVEIAARPGPPIADPVQFLRLFLRNRRPATIISKVTLQPAYPRPAARAIAANARRGLKFAPFVVYEVAADNRRNVFENQRRNAAGRKIAAGITSAALNPATNLGRRRLMREFNNMTRE